MTAQENGQYQAIFLDCYQQLRAVRTLAVWSGVSYAVCIPRSESRSNRSGAASALQWKTNASSRQTGRWTVSHVLCGDLQDTPELDEQVFSLIFRTLQPYMLP